MTLLDSPLITKIRRNHGLEHATIHLLSRRNNNLSLVGRSDWSGFTLYGSVDTAEVRHAAIEALQRLRRGESDLAVHPRCGTVLATTGLFTGLAAFLAVSLDGAAGRRFRWGSIPAVVLAATAAAILAQPIGMLFQKRVTVSGVPGNLEIKDITVQTTAAGIVTHRVNTTQ